MTGTFAHNKSYRAWFTADTASASGLALRTLALSLIGYAITNSTIAAGWIGTIAMIVQQAASTFGGTFVDRHNRKHLIVINAISGTIAWGIITILLIADTLNYATLLIIATIASGINGFLSSATDAMLRTIININDYPQARSLNEGRDAMINMAGNPISGFLYSIHPSLPFLTTTILYAVSGAAATHIHSHRTTTNVTTHTTFLHDFTEGWKWTLSKKLLRTTLIVAALLNFGVNGIQYAIQLNLASINTNSTLIGLTSGGISLMMLIGSLLANKLSNKLPVGKVICFSYSFICICAIPMALNTNYWTILIANSLMGLPFPVINSMLLGFIYAKTPTTMQGRITSTLTVPSQILSSFCSATAGTLLSALGFNKTILTFLIILIISTIITLASHRIRTIPKTTQWENINL